MHVSREQSGPAMNDDEVDEVSTWRSMSKDDGEDDDVDFGAVMRQAHDASAEDVLSLIDKVLQFADQAREASMKQELDDRKMVKSNNMVTLRVLLHEGDATQNFRLDVVASAQFAQIQQQFIEQLGARWKEGSHRLRLSWLRDDGSVVELSQTLWRYFIFTNWCTQPWVVHAHTKQQAREQDDVELPLHHVARILFQRYDLNRNGVIERPELSRLLRDVRLERFECSPSIVQRFMDHEFDRLDHDGSGGIDLAEFTLYVSRMTAWMRTELLELSNDSSMFELAAQRAVEGLFPPTALPNDDTLDDDQEMAVIKTNIFGIRLEVPMGAVPNCADPKISIRTLAESSVTYLAEADLQADVDMNSSYAKARGLDKKSRAEGDAEGDSVEGFYNLPFTPIVRIDFPAFENGEPPEMGSARAPHFLKPLTLVMPHCFDTRDDGAEGSIAMLGGAPHGATKWEPIGTGGADDPNAIELKADEIRVKIPYAGTFAAFAKRSAFAVVFAARFHVFSMYELPRSTPSGLRVHLCAELPNQVDEMQLSESSTWGLSTCIGASRVLYLTKGVRFRLRFMDQEETFTWVGVHGHVSFAIPPIGAGGRTPDATDTDARRILDGAIQIEMLAGIGPRASQVRQCARRAGMPSGQLEVPFSTRIRAHHVPKAPVFQLRERTPTDFTVVWKRPLGLEGGGGQEPLEITHYQIDIATTSPSGTYYPWKELWCGPGHESPDPRLVAAQRRGHSAKVEKLAKQLEQENLALSQAMAPGSNSALANRIQSKMDMKPGSAAALPHLADPVFSYSLPVDPSLFGKLRIRCWSRSDERPSASTPPGHRPPRPPPTGLHAPRPPRRSLYRAGSSPPRWTSSSRWSSMPGPSTSAS